MADMRDSLPSPDHGPFLRPALPRRWVLGAAVLPGGIAAGWSLPG